MRAGPWKYLAQSEGAKGPLSYLAEPSVITVVASASAIVFFRLLPEPDLQWNLEVSLENTLLVPPYSLPGNSTWLYTILIDPLGTEFYQGSIELGMVNLNETVVTLPFGVVGTDPGYLINDVILPPAPWDAE